MTTLNDVAARQAAEFPDNVALVAACPSIPETEEPTTNNTKEKPMTTVVPVEHAVDQFTAALHGITQSERVALFNQWIAEGRDPLDLPSPSTWPEFDAKWAKAWRTREAVLTSCDHWDRYYSDLLHVGLIGGSAR